MKKRNFVKLISAILICQGAGLLGSVFTTSSVNNWYTTIQKPVFNPPNWVFAPVWSLLFLMMGISLYLILIKRLDRKVRLGLILFGTQLMLNILWSFFFFDLKNPLIAFIEIIILWFFIFLTTYQFWKIDKKSSYLLLPYLLWVTFAAVLNFYIWKLNV